MTDYEDRSEAWDVEESDSSDTESEDNLSYDISHYPADITLEGYKSRFEKGSLLVPKYQRNYVWDQVRASKLIESFLLGLPVPGVFLYKERKSNKLQIIDGQQRIMSAIKFLEGKFDENRVFKLKNIREPWNGKSFNQLSDSDQDQLENMVLRATIIQQLDPMDDSSVYHIFERLNTGGIRLNSMEVRKCIYEGDAFDTIERLNDNNTWRKILGKDKKDNRLRDAELALRVICLARNWTEYEKPMKIFLNNFFSEIKNAKNPDLILSEIENDFINTCEAIYSAIGEKPFHLRGRLNYAFMDSFMSAVYNLKPQGKSIILEAMEELKADDDYVKSCTYNTSDESVLKSRFEKTFEVLGHATHQN